MAMKAKEIKDWLATVDDEKMVAVDDGGITLVVKGERSYCEVGGIPLDDVTGHDAPNNWEPGWEMHA